VPGDPQPSRHIGAGAGGLRNRNNHSRGVNKRKREMLLTAASAAFRHWA